MSARERTEPTVEAVLGAEPPERHGFACSACDQTYFGAFADHRYRKNIVEIGRCPQCGARIVTEDAS